MIEDHAEEAYYKRMGKSVFLGLGETHKSRVHEIVLKKINYRNGYNCFNKTLLTFHV